MHFSRGRVNFIRMFLRVLRSTGSSVVLPNFVISYILTAINLRISDNPAFRVCFGSLHDLRNWKMGLIIKFFISVSREIWQHWSSACPRKRLIPNTCLISCCCFSSLVWCEELAKVFTFFFQIICSLWIFFSSKKENTSHGSLPPHWPSDFNYRHYTVIFCGSIFNLLV